MALTLAEANRMIQAALAKAEELNVKLAPFGRTIPLVRHTPSCPHYIRDIQPWA